MSLVVIAAWLAFRLSEGPLSLSFLTPSIEAALADLDRSVHTEFDDTVLAWDSGTRTLEIRAINVRAVTDQNIVATVPEIAVELSGPALLRGVLRLRSLSFHHPVIRLHRDVLGQVQFGMGDNTPESSVGMASSLKDLLVPFNEISSIGPLTRVEVNDGDLSIDDDALHTHWHAPHVSVQIGRDGTAIKGHLQFLLDLNGESARFDAMGIYHMATRTVETSTTYEKVRPEAFAGLSPLLQPLAILQLPTRGSVSAVYSLDNGVQELRFDLTGGPGALNATKEFGTVWPISSLHVKGSAVNGLRHVQIDEAKAALGGGPEAEIKGSIDDPLGAMRLDLSARVTEVPVDSLKDLWPSGLANNPRNWIIANLSHGIVHSATARMLAHGSISEKNIQIDQLTGDVLPEGVTVRYLSPMPVIKNVNAVATYDQNAFSIAVKSGEVMGLRLAEGKVVLGGLSAPDQFADITLKIMGPVADALQLIDSKPLGWASQMGIVPNRLKGEAITDLSLKFPLETKLTWDGVQVHATSHTKNVMLPGMALGLSLENGTLALDANSKGMDVSGTAQLGGIPIDVTWRENFTKEAPFRSRYAIRAVLDDEKRRTLGLVSAPFQAPFMSGIIPVDAVILFQKEGDGRIEIHGDLSQTAMTFPSLNWSKKAGTEGNFSAEAHVTGGHLIDVPHFLLLSSSDDMVIEGQVSFVDDQPKKVIFQRAKWGKTDLKGMLMLQSNTLEINMEGASFDAREIISGAPSGQPKPLPDHRKERSEVTPLSLRLKIDDVLVDDDQKVHSLSGTMIRDTHDWQQIRLNASLGNNKTVHIDLQPKGASSRKLRVSSNDAGALFRTFGLFDTMIGGRLSLEAAYDDADPRQPLRGICTVTDYQLVKMPSLARLLTVAALTGIVDLLDGKGISFSNLDVPFSIVDGILELDNLRATGPALGLTAKGQVDLDHATLALAGTVVPAYVLNSALGRIPLVGSLFSAEQGGGLVAMNYSMKGRSDDPEVTVNPLSALTPGFLRKLFDIFDNGSETAVPRDDRAQPSPP